MVDCWLGLPSLGRDGGEGGGAGALGQGRQNRSQWVTEYNNLDTQNNYLMLMSMTWVK
jgi:hypothetical protein